MANDEAQNHRSDGRESDCQICFIPQEILNLILNYLHDEPDLKCLVLTCHRLAARVRPVMMQRDITNRIYNSLSWACFFGDTSLGQSCLDMGASPNAAFFWSESRGIGFERKVNLGDAYETRFDHDDFEFPVYPTKTVSKIPLLYSSECGSCSALSLATKRNHVGIVRLLVEYGADLIEKRRTVPDPVYYHMHHRSSSSVRYGENSRFSHEAVVSHVRSVEVAKVLLAADPTDHVNYSGKSGYTPLEMLLASCSKYSRSLRQRLTESELYSLTKLFLLNGARTKRVNPHGGSVLAAVATGYMSVVQLVLSYTTLDFSAGDEDHLAALLLAIGDSQHVFRDRQPLDETTQAQLLSLLLDAGLSPNQHIEGRGTLLNIEIAARNHQAAQLLLDRGANPNFTDSSNLSPISKAIQVCLGSIDAEDEFIVPLLRAGADIDQPSLWSGGFTPLMLATGDCIPSRLFENLVRFGADRNTVRRLSPKSRPMTVLQCLLAGFPNPDFEVEEPTRNLLKQNKLETIRRPEESHTRAGTTWEMRRKEKLLNFTTLPLVPSHFLTSNGQHLVNWAIENLYHVDLEWAIESILPYYHQTKLPSDAQSPLWALYSDVRVEKYLAFGTLYQTLRITEAMLSLGITAEGMMHGKTILHRVCALDQSEPHIRNLRSATSLGHELDFGQDLSVHAAHWNSSLNSRGVPRFTSTTQNWKRLPKMKHWARYMSCRLCIIGLLIETFMKYGMDLYAQDDTGRTAYELIKSEEVLERISLQLRDLEKEATIDERRKHRWSEQ
ncbi:ankyrin repeat-containing domain protein [Mariannaea sp. PMI_226]|nr:ankyrin repeat-containing domain protein [Mariannaea sp. PMI_226]